VGHASPGRTGSDVEFIWHSPLWLDARASRTIVLASCQLKVDPAGVQAPWRASMKPRPTSLKKWCQNLYPLPRGPSILRLAPAVGKVGVEVEEVEEAADGVVDEGLDRGGLDVEGRDRGATIPAQALKRRVWC
jgi:hypothetical protein